MVGLVKGKQSSQKHGKRGGTDEPVWENIRNYYRIKGDGVAELKLSKAVKSERFKESVRKLANFQVVSATVNE